MEIIEAIEIVDQLRIEYDKKSLTYKAAVIIVYGIANHTVNETRIKQATGYTYTEVISIMSKLRCAEKIYRRKWKIPIVENDLHNVVEITLAAMVGAGELVCVKEELDEVEEKFPDLKIAYLHPTATLIPRQAGMV